jgi:hypothetical protein
MECGEGRCVELFKGESVEIKGKELMLICLYDWLCKAYSLLLPFAELHPDLPQLLTSDLFDKYSHGFAEATGSPIVGTLNNNLQILAQVVARTEPLAEFDFTLHFQFEKESAVGLLWRRREEAWETEREEEDEEEE